MKSHVRGRCGGGRNTARERDGVCVVFDRPFNVGKSAVVARINAEKNVMMPFSVTFWMADTRGVGSTPVCSRIQCTILLDLNFF